MLAYIKKAKLLPTGSIGRLANTPRDMDLEVSE